jgi:hypothetical protein
VTQLLALDHLVVGVPDLAAAMDEFERRLGVAPHFGGRHDGLGTHNAILPLAGVRYLELIAADPATLGRFDRRRPFGLDSLSETRLVTWAVRSRSIEADVARVRDRGFDPGNVLDVSRREPDGRILHWKLTLRAEPFGDGLVPFVIDWSNTPHPAVPKDDTAVPCTLVRFSAVHPDPRPITEALDALGAELHVVTGPKPGLVAELRGPGGSFALD